MTSVKEHIWVSTTNGLWIIDRRTMDARQQSLTDKRFTSLMFDPEDGNIYLGGADGFGISHPEIQAMSQPEHSILLTALYINNQLMSPHTGENMSQHPLYRCYRTKIRPEQPGFRTFRPPLLAGRKT